MKIQTKDNSIRTEFALVLALVFNQVGVVFTIVWILLLVNRVNAASILAITMGMIHLGFAGLQKATAQFRNAVSRPDVNVQRVEFMGNAQRAFRIPELITLDFIRWPHE